MALDKWTDDDFLDSLRQQGDDLADETVVRLHDEHGLETVNRIFQDLRGDHQPLPDDTPAPLREFMEATSEPPAGLDVERLNRGAEAFRTHAFAAAVTLLASSLPSGYSAPCLSRVLTVSNNLGNHPYKRLMGVLQLIVNVSTMIPTAGDERAHLTARKLRLLHSGLRYIVPRYRPDYQEKYGLPVNHEDMLGTIMGFSYLVITGLQRLGVGLTDEQAEDYYYVWRAFMQMIGIYPPGEPQSNEYTPMSVAEAAAFYASYSRRQYVGAEDNPDGVYLSKMNLKMMRDLIPWPLRLLGLGKTPRIAMQELLGAEGMQRVGVQPVAGFAFHHRVFHGLLGGIQKASDGVTAHYGSRFGVLVFQKMIDFDRGGEVRFIVPEDLEMDRLEL